MWVVGGGGGGGNGLVGCFSWKMPAGVAWATDTVGAMAVAVAGGGGSCLRGVVFLLLVGGVCCAPAAIAPGADTAAAAASTQIAGGGVADDEPERYCARFVKLLLLRCEDGVGGTGTLIIGATLLATDVGGEIRLGMECDRLAATVGAGCVMVAELETATGTGLRGTRLGDMGREMTGSGS